MYIISHRGCLDGPDSSIENHPDQIKKAIDEHFDVEVDLWKVGNEFYLGHDKPTHKINFEFISRYKSRLWIHCKNKEVLNFLNEKNWEHFNYFWHENDTFAMTSLGYVWNHFQNNEQLSKNVVLLFNVKDLPDSTIKNFNYYYICTDYPRLVRNAKYNNSNMRKGNES